MEYAVGDKIRIKVKALTGEKRYKDGHQSFAEENNYIAIITDVYEKYGWYRFGEFIAWWTEKDIVEVIIEPINTRFEILDL